MMGTKKTGVKHVNSSAVATVTMNDDALFCASGCANSSHDLPLGLSAEKDFSSKAQARKE
jgi:hypothetical protein